MNDKKPSIGKALVRTVAGDQLGDAIFELAEGVLHHNLAEGVLKDLPIVGPIVKLARAGQSISDELFLRKLERFLGCLSSVSIEDRKRLLEQYPDSSDEQRVLGENLLLVLERLDDVKKPAILARFFSAYIKFEIDYVTFTRLARALEKFNMELLPNLVWYYKRSNSSVNTPEDIVHELSLAGLITVGLAGSGTFGGAAGYRNSSLGDTFLALGFDVHR